MFPLESWLKKKLNAFKFKQFDSDNASKAFGQARAEDVDLITGPRGASFCKLTWALFNGALA